MLVNAPIVILYALQVILNSMLNHHMFPTNWRITVVSEFFKNKGSLIDATKYRPISLVQLLAKLFDFILLGRFKNWFVPADRQTAYQASKEI